MLVSMTGFGLSKCEFLGKTIRVEIKSLNARNTEIRTKIPNNYRDRELDLRKKVMDALQRGKIDVTLSLDGFSDNDVAYINAEAFRKYYNELNSLKIELGIDNGDILQSILRIPQVIGQNEELASEEEWQVVDRAIDEALQNIQIFRNDEGKVLKDDLMERVITIENNLKSIDPYESERLVRIKERLKKNMDEFAVNQNVDHNRYEQEILYYLEKLDINEEKVRLKQHCTYFIEELNSSELQKGRKLSFIAQEIGREINTIGAKANDSNIQQIVVMMKDDLEKIKEQLANIL